MIKSFSIIVVTYITLIHIFSVKKNQQSHREQKQEADQAGMSGEELKVGHADEDCIQPKHCSLCVLNKDKACSFFLFFKYWLLGFWGVAQTLHC